MILNLDVVVPTYKRSHLLRLTLSSLLQAPVPEGMDVSILVVDNNSNDDTESVVREIQAAANRRIVYIKETMQGLSHARNAGIRNGTAELIGFLDDDEEVEKDWFNVIFREFSDPATELIGGTSRPNWKAPVPKWLPPRYHMVLAVHLPTTRFAFKDPSDHHGLWGGNAVFRRSVFERIGMFSTTMGRTSTGLLSNEDQELYSRVLDAGLRGFHVPDLIMYHSIPADRVTRRYFRRWHYWHAVSCGVMDRVTKEPVHYLLGIPRYRIGKALRELASIPRHLFITRDLGKAFAAELEMWDILGFLYGEHFFRSNKHYGSS